MTKDILVRLSWLCAPRFSSVPVADTIAEAANEIVTLRNRNKRLEHQVRVLQIANEETNSKLAYWTNKANRGI